MKSDLTKRIILDLVQRERTRQDKKWGVQNHSPEFWTGILGEEFGEYCQAVNETVFYNGKEAAKMGGNQNMLKELTHVAAVAIGAMECLLRKYNDIAVETMFDLLLNDEEENQK